MSFVINPIQKMLAEGRTSLRPEDIKAYGIERFIAENAARGPLAIPDLRFTEEENRLMDQILAEERQAKDNAARY